MLVKTKVKYIQTLGQKKYREESGQFIAEGPRLIQDLLDANPDHIAEIFALGSWIKMNEHLPANLTITPITEIELEKISQLTTPHEVLAIVNQFDPTGQIDTKGEWVLALDGIRDPGNLGTLVRNAEWFGLKQVVCSLDSVDIYNPKTVQATMGSIARVRVFYRDLDEWLDTLKDVPVYAAALEGKDVSKLEKLSEGIIVIGNEANGISPSIMNKATLRITIPGKGKGESLNAAVAAGIILSHLI
ncbi:MAG TPA: RNA methyltransferase [Chitinophagaceae bacterium]|nr:RNA methyltransferase [Chitinophagaceae bacterium]